MKFADTPDTPLFSLCGQEQLANNTTTTIRSLPPGSPSCPSDTYDMQALDLCLAALRLPNCTETLRHWDTETLRRWDAETCRTLVGHLWDTCGILVGTYIGLLCRMYWENQMCSGPWTTSDHLGPPWILRCRRSTSPDYLQRSRAGVVFLVASSEEHDEAGNRRSELRFFSIFFGAPGVRKMCLTDDPCLRFLHVLKVFDFVIEFQSLHPAIV